MKAGVIGLGKIGFEFGLEKGRSPLASHVGCYIKLLGASNVAVVDVNQSQLKKVKRHFRSESPNLFSNFENMLNTFKPEVVSICTPTNTHAKIACAVAAYPSVKSIFLEKPIAQSLEETDAIIDACRDHNVKLTVNHQRRWNITYQMIADDEFKVRSMIGLHPGPLLRTGIHMVDLFNWMANKQPLYVQAFGNACKNYITDKSNDYKNYITDKSNDYNISGIINYEDGVTATLLSGEQMPYVLFELDLLSEDMRIRITENGNRVDTYMSQQSERYSGLKELQKTWTTFPPKHFNTLETPLYYAIKEACHFTDPEKNSCSGVEARNALQVALALHYSMCSEGCHAVNLDQVPRDYKVHSY